jgi:hypothetical protein
MLQRIAARLEATTWGRGSDGRAPRLHRGGAGSTPAVSTIGAAARRTPSHRFAFLLGDECGLCLLGLTSVADAGRAGIGGGQDTFNASVVSRAAHTFRTVAAQVRLLPEALCTRTLFQRQSAGSPARRCPFDSGRPLAHAGPWCNGEHHELQPRWSGFESWRACLCSMHDRRGPERLGYLMADGLRACGSNPHPDRTPRPRRNTNLLLRAETGPVIDS